MTHPDLDSLEREALDSLKNAGLAVFPSRQRKCPEDKTLLWDVEQNPSSADYVAVAAQLGVKVVSHAHQRFDSDTMESLVEELRGLEFAQDELRDSERELKRLRSFKGFLCAVQLAFDQGDRTYVLEAVTPWYQDYLTKVAVLETLLDVLDESDDEEDGEEEDEDDSPRPYRYFPKN